MPSILVSSSGGLEYKSSIADTIITIIEENSEAKESGLSHLCEFIEDCEHTSLAVRILHLLGNEGPRTTNPSRYIRYIYNRVVLENATVRAAAVAALARFGALCDDLLPNILVLLTRCQADVDDEVRDRATYFRVILEQQQQQLCSHYILNGLHVSVPSLEKALHTYTLSTCETPFDMRSVPAAHVETPAEKRVTRHDMFVEKLSDIPQIAKCGALFKASQPVDLTGTFSVFIIFMKSRPFAFKITESEIVYVVRCIKHVFPQHLVLQFDCTNTLNDHILENASVQVNQFLSQQNSCAMAFNLYA